MADAVRDGVTYRVEKAAAAVAMAPALRIAALRVIANVEERGPRIVAHRRWIRGPLHMGLAAVTELVLRPRAAPRTRDQQHQCATAAAAASLIRRPLINRCRLKGAASKCGVPVAMVAAKTWPEPGVALKPPVPQPQLTNNPGIGVGPMIGERSGAGSTMPPQLRSIRRRRKEGNNSQIACTVSALTCRPPVWL